MGIPAPAGLAPNPTPPAGDQANAVITGKFSAVGVSNPICIYGSFNVAIWAENNSALTTTAGSLSATVASGTGIAAGDYVRSSLVPPGTVVGAISGTNVTLAETPNEGLAAILGGTDNNAEFGGAVWGGSIQLERSFDGGQTWLVCGVGGGGQGAIYTGAALNGQPLSIVAGEPEKGVLYRLNCTALSNGTPLYRISATGLAAMAWGVPPS